MIITSIWYSTYENTAASGADSIHAQIMFRIVPHFTDLEPLIKPAPIRVPLAAWVELTGNPNHAAAPNNKELDKSLEKPWYGCI